MAITLRVILAFLAWNGPCQAAKVVWQSTPGTPHQASDGSALDAAATFELGVFDSGFTPTKTNAAQWGSHWTVFDRTTFNPQTSFFASSVTFTSNDPPFAAGRQVYMWGSTGGATPEWILATHGDWEWPDAALQFPTTWNIAFASTVIAGTIRASGDPFLLRSAVIEGAIGASLTPEQWLASHFNPSQLSDPEVGQLTSDPDGDGRDNLMEMALGGDPLIAEMDGYGVDWIDVEGFRYLRLTVSKQAIQQIQYRVEVSGESMQWQSGHTATTTLINDVHTLEVRDNVAYQVGQSRFIRLTVQR